MPRRHRPRAALLRTARWTLTATAIPLDPTFAQWGDSRYLDVTLTGELRLADALNHLYVLLPVLDDAKHYWVSSNEVDKLIRAGGSWLATHPAKELITRRYLAHSRELTRSALERLAEVDDTEELPDALDGPVVDRPVALAEQRRGAVLAAVRASGARRVGDLGCGEGLLVRALLDDRAIEHVLAVDVSARALQVAARRLRLDRMSEPQRARLEIFQSSLTYRDDRLTGLDAAVLMEDNRARRPAAAARAGAHRVRLRGARDGDRHDPQRRAQRAVRDAAGRAVPPPRPPLRMDARAVRVVGRDVRGDLRLHRALPAGGDGRPRGRCAHPDGVFAR